MYPELYVFLLIKNAEMKRLIKFISEFGKLVNRVWANHELSCADRFERHKTPLYDNVYNQSWLLLGELQISFSYG